MNSSIEKQKVESRKQKWAETGNRESETERQKDETVKAKMERPQAREIPEWWGVVPDGERGLIRVMLWLLESAKQSPEDDVAWAGRKWRPAIGGFIKTRLIAENGRAARRRQKWKRRVVESASASAEGRITEKRKET